MKKNERSVEVVPLVALPPQSNQKFSYYLPANITASHGMMVRIPFANRVIDGVVWGPSKQKYANLKTIIAAGNKKIATQKDLKWLEEFSKYSFESLSLLTKSLVTCRKPGESLPSIDNKPNKSKFSVRYMLEENDLEAALKSAPAGQTLILVPEMIYSVKISRICEQINRAVFVYGSRIGQKEKNETVNAAATNKNCVIVATHGGIFLPFENLSSVILMEPALSLHRQWNIRPRYDARIGAFLKSKLDKIPFNIFSTLPSFELPEEIVKKITSPDFGKISILAKKWDEESVLSREIINLMRQITAANGKILIFHNVAGYESMYACRNCGNIIRCEHCVRPLERRGRELFCPGCKVVAGILRAFCAKCGSPKISALKTGTRAIELFLKKEFPELTIARIDKEEKNIEQARQSIVAAHIVVTTQKILSIIDDSVFDTCIIPDLSSLVGTANFNALEEFLILFKRLSCLIKRKSHSTFYIHDASSFSSISRHIKDNDIPALIRSDLHDRNHLSFPPFALIATCEKEFTTHNKAKNESEKIAGKIRNEGIQTKINISTYKRRSKYVGKLILRAKEADMRKAVRIIPGSWSIDVPYSINNCL